MEEDFSKHIFDIWFGANKILRIHHKDHGVLEGVLVGFYHGDEGEAFIEEWDFIPEEDYKKLESSTNFPDALKQRIKQADILTIDFKYSE